MPEVLVVYLTVVPIVFEAQRALMLNQKQLGDLLGSSERTVQRWGAGQASIHWDEIVTLAKAVLPVNATIATKLVEFYGQTLESAGIVAPPPPRPVAPPAAATASPPPGPSPQAPFLADSVVIAAAESLDLSPRVVRPSVLAAFERAKAAGLSIDDVIAVLQPPAAPKRAKG